jgi:hypothetical protein
MLTLPEINQVLARYGCGELDVDAAAAALREEPRLADRGPAELDPQNSYAAATLASALMTARTMRSLTPEQSQRLAAAAQIAVTTENDPLEDEEESQPGGDAYHHHPIPTPADAYLNPGAPVIPEAYRNPDPERRPRR